MRLATRDLFDNDMMADHDPSLINTILLSRCRLAGGVGRYYLRIACQCGSRNQLEASHSELNQRIIDKIKLEAVLLVQDIFRGGNLTEEVHAEVGDLGTVDLLGRSLTIRHRRLRYGIYRRIT